VGIIGEGDTSKITPNLRAFEKHFGLPQPRVEIHCVEQRTCGTDTTGDVEWAIDTQSSTAMAPGLSALHLYFSRDLSDQSLDRAFVAWISDPNGPRQASASEGVCEQTPLNGLFTGPLDAVNINSHPSLPVGLALGDLQEPVLDQQLRHAVAEGRTLFASTGDLGFTCGLLYVTGIGEGNGVLYNGLPLVLYPAASPYAVAVGGTVLHTVGSPARRFSEDGWNFGGGGTSHYEPAPAYQVGTPNVTGTCASTPDGGREGAGIPCRGIPDVAAISGDITGNGFAAVVGDHVTSVGGTSLSSPLWAGMWARIQSAAASPVGNGFANPLLYRVGRDPAAAAVGFHDITTGSNPYPAKPGWDYITGFGVPRVRGLVRLIDKR
jgi:subtilase family serine protease